MESVTIPVQVVTGQIQLPKIVFVVTLHVKTVQVQALPTAQAVPQDPSVGSTKTNVKPVALPSASTPTTLLFPALPAIPPATPALIAFPPPALPAFSPASFSTPPVPLAVPSPTTQTL
jgi:hypothetical protein